MYVMIVDDEYYARKAIAKIVSEWGGCTRLEETDNGASALALAVSELPDIMLVDVRMPVMDGIELCRRLRELSDKVDIVIISGYADFSYAQQAIHCRVEGYLLKPVIASELTSALDKLREARCAHAESEARYAGLARAAMRLINGNSLAGMPREDELFSRVKRFGLIVIRLLEADYEQGLPRQLLACLNERDSALAFEHDRYQNELVAIFMGETEDCVSGEIDAFIKRANERGLLLCAWAVSVGPAAGCARDLAECYRYAVYALGMKLIKPSALVIYGADDAPEEAPAQAELAAFSECLLKQDTERAAQLLNERLRSRRHTLRGLNEDYNYMRNAITHAGYALGLAQWTRQASRITLMRLCDFDDMDNLIAYLTMCVHYLDLAAEQDIVEITMDYMRLHYMDDLQLGHIAKNVAFVNACYLSRCIKAKTGKTFSWLLQRVRMEQARKLLERGALSVSNVAELVGYHKVSYFIEVYKKTFGVTPGKTRK